MNPNSNPNAVGNPSTHQGSSGTAATTTGTPKVGEHLGEARDHLRQAGRGAIDSLASAADKARDEYQGRSSEIHGEIAQAGASLESAASEARAAARKQWNETKEYSRELGERGSAWVREHPLKAVGLAALGGYVLSSLMSRGR